MEEAKMVETIRQTARYLEYVQEHYDNVQKAWAQIKSACSDHAFVTDEPTRKRLDEEVKNHDLSKLSKAEFTQFRRKFYPTSFDTAKDSINRQFKKAWAHHQDHNHHHWQRWSETEYGDSTSQKIHCTHMIVDWVAMSLKFGGSAREYFEKNRGTIPLPRWAIHFIYSVFSGLEGEDISIPSDLLDT